MRTNNWAIQLSRSIIDSEIWSKPSDWLKIWLHILMNVNYWDTNDFKRWENFFRYDIIALDCRCSINTVNKCIKYLKVAEQIQNRKTTRGAIITVINYDKYQDLSNYGRTEEEQKKNKGRISTDTIKEESKEDKKINNKTSKEVSTEVEVYWREDINDMQSIIKQTIESNWMIYKAWNQERNRIQNILTAKEFWKVCEKANMSREEFVINIINLATKLKYWKPIYNWVDLYSNYAAVYNKWLETKNELLQHKILREIW